MLLKLMYDALYAILKVMSWVYKANCGLCNISYFQYRILCIQLQRVLQPRKLHTVYKLLSKRNVFISSYDYKNFLTLIVGVSQNYMIL
jgi:hypothetical protein